MQIMTIIPLNACGKVGRAHVFHGTVVLRLFNWLGASGGFTIGSFFSSSMFYGFSMVWGASGGCTIPFFSSSMFSRLFDGLGSVR
jgi:hypothetical protein